MNVDTTFNPTIPEEHCLSIAKEIAVTISEKSELKSKLDTILLSYAKSGKLNFAVEDGDVHDDNAGKKTVSKKTFGNPSQTKKKNRYGSLFA